MDLQHLLVRQAIDIAVGKALEDAKGNVKRSLRGLIDLGLLFSKNDTHKRFFVSTQKAIANPANIYVPMVKRMISDVDCDTIQKIGVNLGYNSWTYGVGKLKKKQLELGERIPWLLIIDISKSAPTIFNHLKRLITESQRIGIYSYIFIMHKQDDMLALCEIANCLNECLFIVKTPAALISEQTAAVLGKTHNVMISIQTVDTGFGKACNAYAFRRLKRNRCLYGYHVYYDEKNMKQVTSSDSVRAAIGFGNLFGVYIARDGVSKQCRDAVYDFACHVRSENDQPLIALEWSRDIRYISESIMHGFGYMSIDLAKNAYFELERKEWLPHPLLESLKAIYLCTSS